ncbi:YjbF family lipoprotein [Rhodobacter sp. TJ_12]|uniref:YjbF family lipoprotein n=1 Tax=Rhodobacter sp. TJ_12 TaxID=2029399 RepID=UPI001CBC15F9|nr:YjbF family lipoprotein [Rhodobacter sp. TJ_12]
MKRRPRAALVAAALALALVGCGNDTTQLETGRQAMSELFGKLRAKRAAAKAGPALDAEAIARSGMASNPGPVLIATLETNKSTSIFAQRGQNGTMRTWLSPSGQAVITRNGLLVGTRGFGHDLMSADTSALSAKLRARSPGQAAIELRYLDGLGIERPLPLTCTVILGEAVSYSFADIDFSGLQMAARCEGHGFAFDASYIVSDGGEILSSRQWIGQHLGYLTIQTLRN